MVQPSSFISSIPASQQYLVTEKKLNAIESDLKENKSEKFDLLLNFFANAAYFDALKEIAQDSPHLCTQYNRLMYKKMKKGSSEHSEKMAQVSALFAQAGGFVEDHLKRDTIAHCSDGDVALSKHILTVQNDFYRLMLLGGNWAQGAKKSIENRTGSFHELDYEQYPQSIILALRSHFESSLDFSSLSFTELVGLVQLAHEIEEPSLFNSTGCHLEEEFAKPYEDSQFLENYRSLELLNDDLAKACQNQFLLHYFHNNGVEIYKAEPGQWIFQVRHLHLLESESPIAQLALDNLYGIAIIDLKDISALNLVELLDDSILSKIGCIRLHDHHFDLKTIDIELTNLNNLLSKIGDCRIQFYLSATERSIQCGNLWELKNRLSLLKPELRVEVALPPELDTMFIKKSDLYLVRLPAQYERRFEIRFLSEQREKDEGATTGTFYKPNFSRERMLASNPGYSFSEIMDSQVSDTSITGVRVIPPKS